MDSTFTPAFFSRLAVDAASLHYLFKHLPVGVAILQGPQHTIEFANDALLDFGGWPPEEMLHRPARDVFPPIAPEEILNRVYTGGEPGFLPEMQTVAVRQNRSAQLACHPLRDREGKVSAVVVFLTDLTGQKRAEEDLLRFRYMVDHTTDVLMLMRADASFAYLNSAALDRWGYTPEEAQRLLVPEVDLILNETAFGELFAAAQTRKIPPFESLHQDKTGLIYPVEINLGALTIGEQPYLFAVARDLTDKKRSEEERRRFESIAEYSHDLIGACDLDGVPIYINPEGLKLVGLEDMQAAKAVRFTDFFFPEDAAFVEKEIVPLVLRNDYAELEIRLRHFQTQAPIWMNYAVFTVKNAADDVVSIATISRNIDERKKAEQALYLSLERFRLLADAMPQLVWTCDAQGRLSYFNLSVYACFGLPPETVAERGWQHLLHPDDRAENRQKWQQALATGEAFSMEHRFRWYDGSYRWQLSRALPQKDLQGQVQMWVGTSTDIHEQKTFTQDLENQVQARTRELREANAELERMNRELTDFAYTSSHDLQAPLRKIQSFASRLLEKESNRLSAEGLEYFHRMQSAAQQMQELIEDLLAYSQTGTTEKSFETTDLNLLVRVVENELEPIIQEKSAQLDFGPLPTLRVIPFQFRQLFANLLGNALKFAQKDRPPRIRVRAEVLPGATIGHPAAETDRPYYHFSIADNGIGFDPAYSARIFEVFQRLHGKHEYSGTGIGLAICKKIVEGHHGIIMAESTPGEGATFHIYVPQG